MTNITACRECLSDITLELNKNCRLINTTRTQEGSFTHIILEFEFYCAKCGHMNTATYIQVFITDMVEDFTTEVLVSLIAHRCSWLKDLEEVFNEEKTS